jgi:hypothetical protein
MAINIYYFWEPAESIPAYIHLCLQTWRNVFQKYNIIPLSYANLSEYLGSESSLIDDTFKALPLQMQKDAILVAVLHENGGIFLDADTIAVNDPNNIFDQIRHTEMIMLGSHMAFVAAQPKAKLLNLYLKSIRERLSLLQDPDFLDEDLPWHFLGNGPLTEALDALAGLNTGFQSRYLTPPRLSTSTYGTIRKHPVLQRMRRRLSLQFLHRQHYRSLDRERHGFIAEAIQDGLHATMPGERYREYWFSADIPVENALANNPAFIGLHHSWTPTWYANLSEKEVLQHDCLLSRTLRELIESG